MKIEFVQVDSETVNGIESWFFTRVNGEKLPDSGSFDKDKAERFFNKVTSKEHLRRETVLQSIEF